MSRFTQCMPQVELGLSLALGALLLAVCFHWIKLTRTAFWTLSAWVENLESIREASLPLGDLVKPGLAGLVQWMQDSKVRTTPDFCSLLKGAVAVQQDAPAVSVRAAVMRSVATLVQGEFRFLHLCSQATTLGLGATVAALAVILQSPEGVNGPAAQAAMGQSFVTMVCGILVSVGAQVIAHCLRSPLERHAEILATLLTTMTSEHDSRCAEVAGRQEAERARHQAQASHY
jgi:hypothetical protein